MNSFPDSFKIEQSCRIIFPGGYVKDGVAYHYIHDHQGNVRQVVEATPLK